jgi:hypothetical protein
VFHAGVGKQAGSIKGGQFDHARSAGTSALQSDSPMPRRWHPCPLQEDVTDFR